MRYSCTAEQISIHALCEEGDHARAEQAQAGFIISIHALCEEGDRIVMAAACGLKNFYPRPLRGGRHFLQALHQFRIHISIHALCEEGDTVADNNEIVTEPISIHALCEEGDYVINPLHTNLYHFYPRPLRGGRRWCYVEERECSEYFYPRPLRGGRLTSAVAVNPALQISIHALCEEGDARCQNPAACPRYFYPRPLRGGRPTTTTPASRRSNFYPRPLRGGRRTVPENREDGRIFLSTPSARRATGRKLKGEDFKKISIHALCEEGDLPVRR